MLMRILLGIGLVTWSLGCSRAEAPMSESELRALDDTITTLMNSYADALMSLDPDAITAFYADDPAFRVYLDGQSVTRAGLVGQVSGLGSVLESLDAAWEDIHVTPLGRDAALGSSRFERTLVDAAGDTIRDWGTATWVWVRRDEGWQVIHGHGVHYPGLLP